MKPNRNYTIQVSLVLHYSTKFLTDYTYIDLLKMCDKAPYL